MRPLLAIAAAVLTAAALAAPAAAHVQVRPALAAPGDPVLFEVIVPGERDAKTVEVTLQVPKDVLPFSFNDPPGWERENREASDGSLEAIVLARRAGGGRLLALRLPGLDPGAGGRHRLEGAAALRRRRGRALDRRPRLREPGGGDQGDRLRAAPERGRGERRGGGRGRDSPAPAATAAPASAPAEEDDDSPLPLILGIAALVISLAALALALRPRKPAAA